MLSSAIQKEVAVEEHLDLVFHALGNRTRRQLLSRLATGPAMVTELAAPIDMSLPAVGKHLRVLEKAGLVQRTIDGRVHNCALIAHPLQCALVWIVKYRLFWEENMDALVDYLQNDSDEEDGHFSHFR
jgi:DNA-binding transcriptional ArsR family regulator